VIFVVAASLLLAACGARTGLRSTGDASTPPALVDGVVMKACAPNDGPALLFTLGKGGSSAPTCQAPGVATGVIILIWSPLPAGPGTFAIGDGSFASGSNAYACTADSTCTQATGGTLVLTELGTTTASGSYSLTTPSGTVSASFEDITFCAFGELYG